MKQKAVLIIAMGMGLLAFVLTHLYLKAELTKIYGKARKVSIVVARESLIAGTVLTTQNTTVKEQFESSVANSVFRADKRQTIIGATLRHSLQPGEAISWIHVGRSSMNELTGLSGTITTGMRAISIPVSAETAVSGLVRPNDKVDILGTFSFISTTNAAEMETVTFTVLQHVTVLATGQETGRAELEISSNSRRSSYNTVTIAVSPEEAELLAFAINAKGSLMLTLRNPNDNTVHPESPPIDFTKLQQELPRLNQKRVRSTGELNNPQYLRRD
jgi:pilus assembly protein CpaB